VNNELEWMRKEAVMAYIKIFSRNLTGGIEEPRKHGSRSWAVIYISKVSNMNTLGLSV
jgi:hypothetical protein